MLTNTERESIKKSLEAATPGEWQIDKGQHYHAVISKKGSLHSVVCSYVDKDNIELLSNAPTWLKQQDEMIEQLLAEVERLKPRPVVCNKPCLGASEADHYVGMHMSNEECPACRHTLLGTIGKLEAEVRAKDAEIERLTAQRNQAQHDRWEYEKGASETHSQLSEAIRILEWYADETNWIQGRYEGGVFFAKIEDDRGSHARIALDGIQSQVSKE